MSTSSIFVVLYETPKHNRVWTATVLHPAPPVQPETNPHFLGKYKPTTFPSPAIISARYLRAVADVPIAPSDSANTRIIAYNIPRPSLVRTSLLYYERPALDVPIVIEAETNTHFIGRFRATTHILLAGHRQNPALDVQRETNTNFLGRFTPTAYKVSISLRQNVSFDQTETNVSFLGRHTPTVFANRAITTGLYTTGEAEDVQRETNINFLGRFFPSAYLILRQLRQNEARDVPVAAEQETNTHFLGTFEGYTHSILTSLWQNASDAPVAETNIHFLGRFTAPAHRILGSLRQRTDTVEPNAFTAETNTHFLGRFVPTQHRLLAALRQRTDTVSTAAFTAEAQPHFLGHYAPAQYPPRAIVFSLYLSPETSDVPGVVVQETTNVSTFGRFNVIVHRIATGLRQNVSFDQTETNQHWLGRFAPAAYKILRQLRQNEAGDIFVTPAETPVNFLGRYRAPVHSRFNFNTWDTAVPQTDQANVHFLGKFTARTHVLLAGLRQHGSFDFTETQPHFLGRFTAPRLSILAGLRQNPALDVFVELAGRDWIGRFKAQVHTIQTALRQTPNTDFRIAGEASTEPHFIGRHTPATFRRFSYNSLDTAVPVAAGDIPNPHFLGKHTPRTHAINPHLRMTDYQRDFVIDQPNINFLGRFKAQVFAIQAALRQNPATDVQAVVQAETNVHFLGRHAPASYRIAIGLRQNVPTDTDRFETNVHFIGKHTPRSHTINPALRHARALDNAPEVQPHFLGRFKAPVFARFAYNTWDTRVPVADRDIANPHFLGRYTVAKHRFLVGWRQNEARDLPPEQNPHFLGRYAPRQHVVLPGFRQNIPLDIFITPETQPHFLGHFTPTTFDLLSLLRMNPDVAEFIPTTPGWVFPVVEAASIVPLVEMAHGVMPSVSRLGDVVSSHSPNPIWRD